MTPDEKFMQRALDLAKRGAGRVAPNPMVGCVIVQGQKIITEGYHKKFGGPHAEVNALRKIKKTNLKKATMYVTLEPCHHFGKTPPCVDAVLKSGIQNVVIAMKDPNPLTAGRSIQKLRRAGVQVRIGVLGREAKKLNAPFIKHVTTQMPYVTAKVALSLNWFLSANQKQRTLLSGPESFKITQNLRAQHAAILVGRNTVLQDDPLLNVRNPKKSQPIRVLLDSQLRTSPQSKIFNSLGGPVWIFHAPDVRGSRLKTFAKLATCIPVAQDKNGFLDLQAILFELGQRGVQSVLIEGGEAVLSSLAKDHLADDWFLVMTPHRLPENGLALFSSLSERPVFKMLDFFSAGRDIWIHAQCKA